MNLRYITEALEFDRNHIEKFICQNRNTMMEYIGVLFANTEIETLKSLRPYYAQYLNQPYKNGFTVLDYFAIYAIYKDRGDLLALCIGEGFDINKRILITINQNNFHRAMLPCTYQSITRINAWHYRMDGFQRPTTITVTPALLAYLRLSSGSWELNVYGQPISAWVIWTPEYYLLSRITRYNVKLSHKIISNSIPESCCSNLNCPLTRRVNSPMIEGPGKLHVNLVIPRGREGFRARKEKFSECKDCSFVHQPVDSYALAYSYSDLNVLIESNSQINDLQN